MADDDERQRKPTEKGLQWQIDTKTKEFNRCLTTWNRTANKLRVLLGDEDDVSMIKEVRDTLQKSVDKLIAMQENVDTLQVSANIDDDTSANRLDEVESEHNNIMKRTLEVLTALREDGTSSRISTKKSKKSSPVSSKRSKECQEWVNDIQQEPISVSHPKPDNLPNIPNTVDTVGMLIEQMRMTRLPLPEPSVFAGDPLLYPAWKHAFDVLIEQSGIKPMDRFFYLQKYLKDQPLELVRGYALIGDERAYYDAQKALQERYGDSFIIANAFRDKLERWPKLASKDALSLRKLSDFLHQCVTAMERIGNLHHLNDERENRKILAKLPDWLVVRWSRIVIKKVEKDGNFPPFRVFANFVQEEAKIACYPITSLQGLKDGRSERGRPTPDVRTLGTNVTPPKANFKGSNERQNRERFCYLCKKNHTLDECNEFASKDLTDRRNYIMEKGLCYGCLKAGHISKYCRRRSTCRTCRRRHPSSLHEDRKPEQRKESGIEERPEVIQSSHSHVSISQQTNMKSTMIVPVWLSHPTTTDERMVYALLDTQSDTTFLLEHTKHEMDLHGVEVNLLLSTMSAKDERVTSERINGLTIRAYDGVERITLPTTYTRRFIPANPEHIPTPEMAMSVPYLSRLANHLLPLQECEIGLLIGYDCARALIPRDVIPPDDDDGPYGLRTDLGWSIVGMVKDDEHTYRDDPIGVSHRLTSCEVPTNLRNENKHVLFAHKMSVKEEITPTRVIQLMETDFSDVNHEGAAFSQNDVKFMNIMEDEIHKSDDGHYEMPLPFKDEKPNLLDNKFLAKVRLEHLKRKFKQNPDYHKRYSEVMETLLQKGYAESAPNHDTDGPVWYIPHHAVLQPNKLRVVFDCSAQYKGQSLNSHLLTGPDLTNKLIGVLCRFRLENVAFICDIQEMFHQFRVNEEDRDYLRFLWWRNGNFNDEPCEFRMKTHLFGAASSPGCANFGLRQIAKDYAVEFGDDVKDFIHQEFYVDDGLKSLPTVHQAVDLITRTKELCEKGGLHLHKFVSNSREVLMSVAEKERSKNVREINLLHDDLPLERALGVQWCVESDSFNFRVTLQDKPLTRRGVLSTVMSIYDPLGLLAPVVLIGKQILQELCKLSADWDDPLPDNLRERWEKWRINLMELQSLSIKRCYKPAEFGAVQSVQFHHFSDASTKGYGQCTYMRLTDAGGRVHCTLVIGKARVAPLKSVTVPRLELTAAAVAVKVKTFLDTELEIDDVEHVFWTDSKVVLGYIKNTERRFHVFVANRIQQIRDRSSPSQWRYVESRKNPADDASRGLTVRQLKDSKWLQGPEMLWEEPIPKDDQEEMFDVLPDDPEIKKSQAHVSQSSTAGFDLNRLKRFSTWHSAKKAIANCLLLISHLKQRCQERRSGKANDKTPKRDVNVQDLQQAETEILMYVQKEAFGDEIQILKSIQRKEDLSERERKHQIKKASRLHGLDAFLDDKGVLRVGGRIRRGDDSYERKHPAILPQRHHITDLVIRHCHEQTAHQGRGMTLNQIRENGFWVLGSSNRVAKFIRKCVICNKLRSPVQIQKMSDLPSDRVTPSSPFMYCGIDGFGPWVIKEGRKEMKRYGLLFTCMASRAVHIETLNSLTTDAFIQAYRRFTALRGPIRQLRCDRGTNFVGAEAEFKKALSEMDHQKVKDILLKEGCDYVQFAFNVPSASHMGGVWERQIRSIRSVLETLMYQSGRQLDDESLRTLMCEAAAIINSRPLTVNHLNDPTYPAPLTPNHLLTTKSQVLLPPPGNFQSADLYSRKRWRRVQHLVNEFWNRWRKEFLQNLQTRQKWTRPQRDAMIGDIVIVKDENAPRNQWPLARIIEVFPSTDGYVRKVKLAMGDSRIDDSGKRKGPMREIERPIHKLVLLLPREE